MPADPDVRASQEGLVLRPLLQSDLPAAFALQAKVYPAFLVESEEVFASRIRLRNTYCMAACLAETLVGYIIAHGWARMSPPPLGAVLSDENAREVLYIHDLCVDQATRGLDIGGRLVRVAMDAARDGGLGSAELVAVEGAAGYWRRLGFRPGSASPIMAAKLASYGADAQWMTQAFNAA